MSIAVSRVAPKALTTNQWARNGRYPDAAFHGGLAARTNQLLRWRTKEVFSYEVPIANIPTGATLRSRFRFHSSTHARYLFTRFVGALTGSTGSDPIEDQDVYSKLTFDNAGVTVGEAAFHIGAVAGTAGGFFTDAPAYMGWADVALNDGSGNLIEIPADTDLNGLFTDVNEGRLVAASVYEVSLEPTVANGYLVGGQVAQSPIYDEDRGDLTVALRNALKRNGAMLLDWYVDKELVPRTRVSATALNVVDNTSTTISAATPGWTIDLRNRNRLSATTVPCVFAAYAKMSSGTGNVKLIDSSSVVVAQVNVNSSTAQWWTTTVNLPATNAKYDILINGNGAGTLSAYAACLFRYEA